MTVLDTSAVIDFLLGTGTAEQVRELIRAEGVVASPDVLTFEVLAVLRRGVLRGVLDVRRAGGAVEDYGDLAVDLRSTVPLRSRAWELRENLTAADALFVALAEELGEPLATKDLGLAQGADRVGVRAVHLRE